MFFYLISLIIIIVSLLIIIFVIVKKFPSLAAINVESIIQEKESKVRNRLILERLVRKFSDFKDLLAEIFGPLKNYFITKGDKFCQKITELEGESFKRSRPLKKIDVRQEIEEKLGVANKLLADEDFTKTEKVCISIIELDAKNLDAYEILGQVYSETKEYKKARETYRYLVKLLTKINNIDNKHRLANCCADLGLVYQLEGKNSYALNNYQKAIDLEPNNPRFLDLLLKICIILKNKNLAEKTFNDLKKADPDNKKLAELKGEIDSLPT